MKCLNLYIFCIMLKSEQNSFMASSPGNILALGKSRGASSKYLIGQWENFFDAFLRFLNHYCFIREIVILEFYGGGG